MTKKEGTPDFINAPPKSRIEVRQVEKWFDGKVFLCQEERSGEGSSVLGHPYSDRCDGLCRIKHMIDTHADFIDSDKTFQLFIYFIGDEADADVRLNQLFCEVKHRLHIQCYF